MPQRIEPPTHTLPTPSLPRIRWSVEQFENLFAMGLLPEKGYELIEGDVIEKMSVKETHSYVITLLFALFSRLVGFPLLRSQFSLWINETTLPEPDFALLYEQNAALTTRGYVPATNVRLVIEVSDATLSRDLTTKAVLYAGAAIPEYWVVDLIGRRLLIHGMPGSNGYAQVTEYHDTETAVPLFDSMAAFAVADILP